REALVERDGLFVIAGVRGELREAVARLGVAELGEAAVALARLGGVLLHADALLVHLREVELGGAEVLRRGARVPLDRLVVLALLLELRGAVELLARVAALGHLRRRRRGGGDARGALHHVLRQRLGLGAVLGDPDAVVDVGAHDVHRAPVAGLGRLAVPGERGGFVLLHAEAALGHHAEQGHRGGGAGLRAGAGFAPRLVEAPGVRVGARELGAEARRGRRALDRDAAGLDRALREVAHAERVDAGRDALRVVAVGGEAVAGVGARLRALVLLAALHQVHLAPAPRLHRVPGHAAAPVVVEPRHAPLRWHVAGGAGCAIPGERDGVVLLHPLAGFGQRADVGLRPGLAAAGVGDVPLQQGNRVELDFL